MEVKNVSKTYPSETGGVKALQDVSFSLQEGEFTALMGPSGCGKSTLLHLLGGMDVPTQGEIFLQGEKINAFRDVPLSLLRRSQIGFVFQFFHLLPTFSALENVEIPLLLAGTPREEARKKAAGQLEKVGLQDQGRRRPHQLSGGEQQRVAIARALVHRPKLVLADEPTGNLDSANGKGVLELLKKTASSQGCAVLMATHSREAADHADTLIIMRDGQISGIYPNRKEGSPA